ncbi:Homeodomain-like domain-containing protein, partial [Eubacterium pyruvativorans]
MTKYREILRLKSLGFSDRNIARSCSVSRNTVRRVIDRADELSISWPLDFGM